MYVTLKLRDDLVHITEAQCSVAKIAHFPKVPDLTKNKSLSIGIDLVV